MKQACKAYVPFYKADTCTQAVNGTIPAEILLQDVLLHTVQQACVALEDLLHDNVLMPDYSNSIMTTYMQRCNT